MIHSRSWRQFRTGLIAADAFAIVLTYFLADYLRCHLWMHRTWPEMVLVEGRLISGVRIHMKVLAFLPILWPFILRWLGWYDQKWRLPFQVARSAFVGTTILALSMAGLALLFERELYPRAQIGFVAALLPATTLAMRGITSRLGRWYYSRYRRQDLLVGTSTAGVRYRGLLR